MALPLGIITPTPVVAAFKAPWDEPYLPLEEAVLGGTAVGNGANGREVQRWTAFYEAGQIKVAPEGGAVQYTFSPGVVSTVSLAFDSNMQVAVAYQQPDGAHLHYYNSVTGLMDVFTILSATSCRACVDDGRLFNSTASDVIFSYVLDDKLYYRQQRDRYLIERLIGPAQGELKRCGPNVLNRLQWKLG